MQTHEKQTPGRPKCFSSPSGGRTPQGGGLGGAHEKQTPGRRLLQRACVLAACLLGASLAGGAHAAALADPTRPPSAAANDSRPSLYRHGVELVLEGGYADLLSYLRAGEALPQRVLWGSVSLKVEQHPKSVLTLRVYTISRERHWLEI